MVRDLLSPWRQRSVCFFPQDSVMLLCSGPILLWPPNKPDVLGDYSTGDHELNTKVVSHLE